MCSSYSYICRGSQIKMSLKDSIHLIPQFRDWGLFIQQKSILHSTKVRQRRPLLLYNRLMNLLRIILEIKNFWFIFTWHSMNEFYCHITLAPYYNIIHLYSLFYMILSCGFYYVLLFLPTFKTIYFYLPIIAPFSSL